MDTRSRRLDPVREHRRREENVTYREQWLTRLFGDRPARAIFDAMGHGLRLAVPRDGSYPARLIQDPRFRCELPERDAVPESAVVELLNSGRIKELQKESIRYQGGGRIGWREAGLPGEVYRIYTLTQ